jgi:hypothetical protein
LNLAEHPIAILATPKTGNLWIKYVLVNVLRMNSGEFLRPAEIISYFDDPQSDRQLVFHAHVPFTRTLQHTLNVNQTRIISLVRNPLDIFLSLRSHVLRLGPNSPTQAQILSDDPELLRDFAQTYFVGDLAISAIWARHDAIVLRYEDLITDPFNGFSRLGRQLGVGDAEIEHFATFCSRISDIREIRQNARPGDQAHFTSAEIDKWKNPKNQHITEILLQSPSIRSALRLWGYT